MTHPAARPAPSRGAAPPTPVAVALARAPRRAPAAPSAGRRALPRWLRAALGVPLTAKLIGANLLVAGAAAAALAVASPAATLRVDFMILGGALLVALVVNTVLVSVALRPVWELEATAARVWHGDFDARVPASRVADADIARVGRTVNLLLDSIEDDRQRLRALAAQAIRAQDDERSRIARELHDSTAQTIAALTYQLSAAARDAADPALAERLGEIRELAAQAMEELRVLAHTIHPRVLDDLGLVAAIEWLARRTREHSGLDVRVEVAPDPALAGLSRAAAASLYRVAQESIRNVERHAGAATARVSLRREGDHVALEVADDGRGFDLAEAEARRPGMGLFSMRERLALVDGALAIHTAPNEGTRVHARVPLQS